jgi:two-component system KDP operon response regulator KdpE
VIRVLVVEDDKEIRALVKSSLEVEGFEVLTAVSIAEAHRIVTNAKPELIILDLGLPDGDGVELVHSVRKEHNLPIIIISARDQEAQKIRLLDAGADDYLSKPFGVQELLARIRVALRHRGTVVGAAQTLLEVDQLKIDLNARRITLKGQDLHLTPTEYNLLARLVRSAGRVVTHRQLLVDVWGEEFVDHTHYLRLYMGQLRAKLEEQPAEPRYLVTETGVGYRLVTE